MRLLAPICLALLAACASAGPSTRDADPRQVADVLLRSAEAWNRGDFEGFLDPYQRDGRTTFVGGRGFMQGFDALREGYVRSYWADGSPEDSLAFEVIEVRPLDQRAALMLGRYTLLRRNSDVVTSTGVFSLVFVLTDEGWKITHDHTSEAG